MATATAPSNSRTFTPRQRQSILTQAARLRSRGISSPSRVLAEKYNVTWQVIAGIIANETRNASMPSSTTLIKTPARKVSKTSAPATNNSRPITVYSRAQALKFIEAGLLWLQANPNS